MPITKFSAKDIKPMPQEVLDSIKQKVAKDGIDFSDNPEIKKEDWDKIKIVKKSKTKLIALRVDEETLNFFKGKGKGYQSRMNDVLRSYVKHQG
jgi:uncharacterized protein (DUF4415 family)